MYLSKDTNALFLEHERLGGLFALSVSPACCLQAVTIDCGPFAQSASLEASICKSVGRKGRCCKPKRLALQPLQIRVCLVVNLSRNREQQARDFPTFQPKVPRNVTLRTSPKVIC